MLGVTVLNKKLKKGFKISESWRSKLMRSFQIVFYLIVLIILSGCASLDLVPISDKPTGHRQQGQIIWHDNITNDIESNIRFYGELLGWSFERQGEYVVVLNVGVPIAGMVELKPEEDAGKRGGWISYMSTRDVDETVSWVAGTGGKVLCGPAKMKNRGQYAMVAGPQDERLILLDLQNGDPSPQPAPIGSWLWLELWTSNIDQALDFYQSLGEFSAEKNSEEGEEEYWVLLDSENRWQAGITISPFRDIPSQWVPVVRVASPEEIVKKVEALGGRVIIKPDHPLTNGKVALIQDPTGGIFMVESWQESQTEKEQ
jgi:predicted enzyme related to lactoylglutathione lyase